MKRAQIQEQIGSNLNQTNLQQTRKSEIKQALENKDDSNLSLVEDIFSESVHNKLDKLRKDESSDSHSHSSLYEGPYKSLDEIPASLRPLAANMNATVQSQMIVLKLINWYILIGMCCDLLMCGVFRYGNEGYRKAPDNDKVFLEWVEKERHLNLR